MQYIDLQVNGAYGVDFNSDNLTADQFKFACLRLKESGVVGFLPTIITDSLDAMCHRIGAIASFVEDYPDASEVVRGIHIEGPFLSDRKGFYGTHPPQHILVAKEKDAMRLVDAGRGRVRLLTLAPEQDPGSEVTRRLSREGILVFAGHSDASFETLKRALDCGLRGFTHLGNGCVHQVDRQDNIMQRVLALREKLMITMIADGIHLPTWLLKSWLEIIGPDNSIIISDSMSAAGMPAGEYSIGNQHVIVEPSRRTKHRDHGYLAGSASTMADMDVVLTEMLSIESSRREQIMYRNALSILA